MDIYLLRHFFGVLFTFLPKLSRDQDLVQSTERESSSKNICTSGALLDMRRYFKLEPM